MGKIFGNGGVFGRSGNLLYAVILIWLIWGMNWTVMKTANSFFPPMLFVTYRFASGALILLLVAVWLKVPLPEKRLVPWIMITGLLQMALNNTLAQTGMVSLGAGMASVLNYTMPLWVAIMAHFMLGERLTVRKILGIASGLFGLYLLMGMQEMENLYAAFITLLSAMVWALSGVLTKMRLSGCNMVQLVTWQMIFSAVFLILFTTFQPQGDVDWNIKAVLCLLYNGALASAAAFFLWNYVLVRIEAGMASMAVLVVPVVGVLGGIIFLGEPFTLQIAIGMSLILLGLLIVVSHKSKR